MIITLLINHNSHFMIRKLILIKKKNEKTIMEFNRYKIIVYNIYDNLYNLYKFEIALYILQFLYCIYIIL